MIGLQELSSVFDSALDLSTIARRLHLGEYDSPEALSDVVNNLLQNCRSMADNQRSPVRFIIDTYQHYLSLADLS